LEIVKKNYYVIKGVLLALDRGGL